jgi:hypothetical protein
VRGSGYPADRVSRTFGVVATTPKRHERRRSSTLALVVDGHDDIDVTDPDGQTVGVRPR